MMSFEEYLQDAQALAEEIRSRTELADGYRYDLARFLADRLALVRQLEQQWPPASETDLSYLRDGDAVLRSVGQQLKKKAGIDLESAFLPPEKPGSAWSDDTSPRLLLPTG